MDKDAVADLLAGLEDDSLSTELQRQSGHLLNELSHAQVEAAENLLAKAARSLSAGDDQRAQRLIDRAAAMPYDPREESSPGIWGARMLIHTVIVDEFEYSDPDDLAWLDVVLAVHPHLDEIGQAHVASTVHGLVLQQAFYDVSVAEARHIQAAFGDAPLEADLDDGPETTLEQRRAIIGSLTAALAALNAAFGAAHDE